MAWHVWAIIILVILSWAQYSHPEKTDGLLAKAYDPLNDFVDEKNPFGKDATEEPMSICPNIINYVCGSDGITYDNSCQAAEAGILQVTPGRC